jgi:hypothetical protein
MGLSQGPYLTTHNTGWTQKHSLISSSYKIKTYLNTAFHCPLAAGGKIKNFLSSCICSPTFIKTIPVSFDFITTWNQRVFLCSLCIHKPHTSIVLAVFEPIFPESEQPQIQVLNHTALGSTTYGIELLIMAFSYTKSSITEDKPLSCIRKRKARENLV